MGRRTWQLAPAYDITHAYNPNGEWTYQHLLGVDGKFGGITRDDLLRLADRFAIGPAPRIIDQVKDALADWPSFAKDAGFGEGRDAIRGRRLSAAVRTRRPQSPSRIARTASP